MLYALFFVGFAAAGAVPHTSDPTSLGSVVPTAPAAALSPTPIPVVPLYRVGTPIVYNGTKGNFIPEADLTGWLVVATSRYADEAVLVAEGKRAREGGYAVSSWKLVVVAVMPLVVEVYKARRK